MDFVVFADDWGRHPSTTQHLIRALPAGSRVVWINSIGMRSPGRGDLSRIVDKVRRSTASRRSPNANSAENVETGSVTVEVVHPRVLPFHGRSTVRSINRRLLRRDIHNALRRIGAVDPVVLYVNPVAAHYVDAIDHRASAYLRLDDYARLPGVDPALVEAGEMVAKSRADHLFATARALMETEGRPWNYLPQGVDSAHFQRVGLDPRESKVLGFFGLLESWLDYDLIEGVARAMPDWTLEFLGKDVACPERVRSLPNVHLRGKVPYASLPDHLENWSVAWIPFQVNELTIAVNPLKAREYLAAGLPTVSTALPELVRMKPHATIVDSVEGCREAVESLAATDDRHTRLDRRRSVEGHGWSDRAASMRRTLEGPSSRAERTSPGDCSPAPARPQAI